MKGFVSLRALSWGRWVLLGTSSTLKPQKHSVLSLLLFCRFGMIETLCLPTFHKLGQNSVLPTVQQTTIKTTKLTTQKLIRNLQLKIVPTKNLGLFFSIQMCVTVKTQYTLLMFITSLKSMAWSLKIKYYQSNISKHKARSVFTPHNSYMWPLLLSPNDRTWQGHYFQIPPYKQNLSVHVSWIFLFFSTVEASFFYVCVW